jgi:hypothetical protein
VAQAEPAVQVVLEASEDLLVLGVLEVLEVRVVQEGLGVQEDQLELEAPAELEVAAVVAAEPWATQLFQHLRVQQQAAPEVPEAAEPEVRQVLVALEVI